MCVDGYLTVPHAYAECLVLFSSRWESAPREDQRQEQYPCTARGRPDVCRVQLSERGWIVEGKPRDHGCREATIPVDLLSPAETNMQTPRGSGRRDPSRGSGPQAKDPPVKLLTGSPPTTKPCGQVNLDDSDAWYAGRTERGIFPQRARRARGDAEHVDALEMRGFHLTFNPAP